MVKGSANATENASIVTIGSQNSPCVDLINTVPTIGPVHENDTSTRVRAMKNTPARPFLSDPLSLLFTIDCGRVISNAPKNEAAKMLHIPDLKLSCTCVRVPIARAHSESLNLEFEEAITPQEAREILSKAEGVRVVDDPLNGGYPMPLDATAKYDVLAGRIRQDISRDDGKGLEMFVSGDQLLRGAALNAVEIAEHLIKRGLV